MAKSSVITQEFKAIQACLEALEPLDATQRQFAVAMILSRLGMVPTPGAGVGASLAGAAGAVGAVSSGLRGITVKDFLKQKAPTTDLERFVCLAHYLTEAMDTPSFTTKQITKLNGDAHGQDFSNAAATAMNAVNQSKYLSRAGGGKKRITTLGEAVVDALPDRAKVKEVLAAAPRRGKKRGSKKGRARR